MIGTLIDQFSEYTRRFQGIRCSVWAAVTSHRLEVTFCCQLRVRQGSVTTCTLTISRMHASADAQTKQFYYISINISTQTNEMRSLLALVVAPLACLCARTTPTYSAFPKPAHDGNPALMARWLVRCTAQAQHTHSTRTHTHTHAHTHTHTHTLTNTHTCTRTHTHTYTHTNTHTHTLIYTHTYTHTHTHTHKHTHTHTCTRTHTYTHTHTQTHKHTHTHSAHTRAHTHTHTHTHTHMYTHTHTHTQTHTFLVRPTMPQVHVLSYGTLSSLGKEGGVPTGWARRCCSVMCTAIHLLIGRSWWLLGK